MLSEETYTVVAETIGDAWRDVMLLCVRKGWDYVVESGSYQGQIRKQLKKVMIEITNPRRDGCLAPIVTPEFATTNDDVIEAYFERYIMSDRKEGKEQYTYGEFITKQLPRIIELLRNAHGKTNQATMAIGDVSTTFLSDPPCLRVVDFKMENGQLDMDVLFRSWDLYAGLPQNLGGLRLLQEYVYHEILDSIPRLKLGSIIAYCSGLHIYEQYFANVNALNIDKIQVSDQVWADKTSFQKKLDSGEVKLVI